MEIRNGEKENQMIEKNTSELDKLNHLSILLSRAYLNTSVPMRKNPLPIV